MSYLLLDDKFDELLDDAVDEGLHDIMAVCSFIGPHDPFNGVMTPDGAVPLEEVKDAIRRAFHAYAQEDFENA